MAVDSTAASPSKLGLGGTTINAMALIAPGAFLWTTYALQAQAKAGDVSSAPSMWSGLVLAIILCFLTAIAYAELAKLYPGPGSSYLFAEQSFLNHEISRPGARVAKFLVGWASHIYYWIYPAVMVAMMGALCGYLIGSLTGGPSGNVHTQLWDPTSPPGWVMALVAVIFTFAVTLICIRGVQGSTKVNIAINVIQITALVIVSIMFFIFRSKHPDSVMHYVHPALTSVLIPHGIGQVISQAALAILLLVGFESVTSLGDEVHNPNRTIPLAVLLSLAIQGLFCYLLEYFAANLVVNNAPKGSPLHYGITEAGGSSAPIGDMLKIVGTDLFGSQAAGFWIMILVGATVFIALIGTTISCMNTGARVTYAMGKDDDSPIPSNLGILHGKTLSPYKSLWVLCIITAVFGAYGAYFALCGSAVTDTSTAAAKAAAAIPNSLLVITYLSNFGTFALYGMTCILCIMAYSNKAEKNILKHYVIPALGAVINFYLMYYYLNIGPEAKIAFIIAAIFAAIGLVFLAIWGKASGKGVIHRHEGDLAATRIKSSV